MGWVSWLTNFLLGINLITHLLLCFNNEELKNKKQSGKLDVIFILSTPTSLTCSSASFLDLIFSPSPPLPSSLPLLRFSSHWFHIAFCSITHLQVSNLPNITGQGACMIFLLCFLNQKENQSVLEIDDARSILIYLIGISCCIFGRSTRDLLNIRLPDAKFCCVLDQIQRKIFTA